MKPRTPTPLLDYYQPDVMQVHSDWQTITIRWPSDSKIPTIRGKWHRLEDGRIEARYTRDELAKCFEIFETLK